MIRWDTLGDGYRCSIERYATGGVSFTLYERSGAKMIATAYSIGELSDEQIKARLRKHLAAWENFGYYAARRTIGTRN